MNVQRETRTIPTEPVARGNLRQQVTARLMSGIFLGRFRSGQRLVVQHLAQTYQASPTPVREALVELATFGLVGLLPNRGAVVQPFGPRRSEISQIRRLLEAEATRCASGRIPGGDLAALEEELNRLELLPHDQLWDDRAPSTPSSTA
jgi:DNA-binding GntR family transcriptional regulator